jgi:hypothetical protein
MILILKGTVAGNTYLLGCVSSLTQGNMALLFIQSMFISMLLR